MSDTPHKANIHHMTPQTDCPPSREQQHDVSTEKQPVPFPYEDIVNLQYPPDGELRHKPMSMEARAAQFAPFAALTGHDRAIEQTARRIAEEYDDDHSLCPPGSQ